MGNILERVKGLPISCRGFLKASAGTVGLLALSGCAKAENKLEETTAAVKTTSAQPPSASEEVSPGVGNSTGAANGDDLDLAQGTWVTASCWHNCGGRCLNKALVVDGVVVRQKTDDTHEDSWEYFQNRSCPRGRSQRQQCFGADRIKYPLKRKSWQPGGGENSHGELRGEDEWERITWEEALDLIAEEIRRIERDYGPRATYNANFGANPLLCCLGGHVNSANTDSYGSWKMGALQLGTSYENYNPDTMLTNDRFDLENAETIVLYGCNPAWASAGSPSYHFMRACIGCRACQVACKDKNRRETAGVLYREVHTYEAGKYPHAGMFHLSMACNHCEEPACVAVCPTGAMHREEDGTVRSNEEVCIGCQTCAEACPYHAPKYLEDLGIIGKCDSCYTLRAAGQNPACVDACLMRCLDFGDLDELSKKYGNPVKKAL